MGAKNKKRTVQAPVAAPKQKALDPSTHGTLVKYIGALGASAECDNCGRKTVRGMVRVKNDLYYCSVTCIESTIPKEISE